MTPSIAALDVPLAQVESEAAALNTARRLRIGIRAEQRHLLLDPDPDSSTKPFADLTKHFAGGTR
jgi:hypothetical protein